MPKNLVPCTSFWSTCHAFLCTFFCTSLLHWIECSYIWHKKLACMYQKCKVSLVSCVVGWHSVLYLLSAMFVVQITDATDLFKLFK